MMDIRSEKDFELGFQIKKIFSFLKLARERR